MLAPRPFRFREWLERESVFSWIMLTPPLLFLIAFLGYPFCYGFYLTFVNRPVADLFPFPVSTVGQDVEAIGRESFGALLKVMKGQKVPREILIPPHLIVRV